MVVVERDLASWRVEVIEDSSAVFVGGMFAEVG